jgi:hypothetical protein
VSEQRLSFIRRGAECPAKPWKTLRFSTLPDTMAVPTGEAHRLPKKCAGFIGGTEGSQGRPQQKRSLPQSLRNSRACAEMVIVRAIARKRQRGHHDKAEGP